MFKRVQDVKDIKDIKVGDKIVLFGTTTNENCVKKFYYEILSINGNEYRVRKYNEKGLPCKNPMYLGGVYREYDIRLRYDEKIFFCYNEIQTFLHLDPKEVCQKAINHLMNKKRTLNKSIIKMQKMMYGKDDI